jgi:small subunit ribosomal protein S17
MKEKNTQKNTVLKGKVLEGIVVSNKMKDTVVVLVERYEKHPQYGKYIQRRKRFQAHDAGNTKAIGDKVSIRETKPISKRKSFIVI